MIEEQEEDDETRQRKEKVRRKAKGLEKEPLNGLSPELQEALMVEDLLFVLMVSSLHRRRSSRDHATDGVRSVNSQFRVSKGVTSNMTQRTPQKTTMNGCKELNSLLIRV